MPFEFERLKIPDVVLIKPKVFGDDRGFFMETYKHSEFMRFGIREQFLQDNLSKSIKNVLRGLHYQRGPAAQGKLVQCLKGKIFDVAVDIRKDSNSFGQWVGIELSEDNRYMLYIPPGFAHGFAVISEEAEFVYKCTKEYSPENDRGILWCDPDININWPVQSPILSDKDRVLPLLKDKRRIHEDSMQVY